MLDIIGIKPGIVVGSPLGLAGSHSGVAASLAPGRVGTVGIAVPKRNIGQWRTDWSFELKIANANDQPIIIESINASWRGPSNFAAYSNGHVTALSYTAPTVASPNDYDTFLPILIPPRTTAGLKVTLDMFFYKKSSIWIKRPHEYSAQEATKLRRQHGYTVRDIGISIKTNRGTIKLQ